MFECPLRLGSVANRSQSHLCFCSQPSPPFLYTAAAEGRVQLDVQSILHGGTVYLFSARPKMEWKLQIRFFMFHAKQFPVEEDYWFKWSFLVECAELCVKLWYFSLTIVFEFNCIFLIFLNHTLFRSQKWRRTDEGKQWFIVWDLSFKWGIWVPSILSLESISICLYLRLSVLFYFPLRFP